MSHSAALIAGGKSTRMGRDKAGIIFEGKTLWCRQFETLKRTGAAEVFVAGECDSIPRSSVEVIPDGVANAGPLAGLVAALERASEPVLVVIAVDMPFMTASFLSMLVEMSFERRCGIVPRLDGRIEPLAAVYLKSSIEIARTTLASGRFALSNFVDTAAAAGELEIVDISGASKPLFSNLNRPADIESFFQSEYFPKRV